MASTRAFVCRSMLVVEIFSRASNRTWLLLVMAARWSLLLMSTATDARRMFDVMCGDASLALGCIFYSSVVRSHAMGISAQNQAMPNYKNTVRSFKLLVGRRFSDPVVQEEIKLESAIFVRKISQRQDHHH